MSTISPKVREYAKAVITVGGFVVLCAGQVADGNVDAGVLYTAGIGVLTTLGVIKARNRKPARPEL